MLGDTGISTVSKRWKMCVCEKLFFSGTAVTPCLRGTEAFLISGKYKKLVNLLDVVIATAGCNFLYYL